MIIEFRVVGTDFENKTTSKETTMPDSKSDTGQRVLIKRSQEDRRQNLGERRHKLRYTLKSNFYIRIRKPHRFKIWKKETNYIATIVDISLNGLGARYVSQDIWPHDVSTLSIVTNENSRLIGSIAYKVISDRKIFSNPKNEDIRKVGIRFIKLTKNQRRQLVTFIQRFGIQPRLNNQQNRK